MIPSEPRTRSHLFATSVAALIAAFGVAAALEYAHKLEQRYIHALAPELHSAKLLGVELQRLAFAQPDRTVTQHLDRFFPENWFPFAFAATAALWLATDLAAATS